jgi:serine/threonine protein phosphatase PrpC
MDKPYDYLNSAGNFDLGSVRKNNEDNFGLEHDKGWFCVADGMGGEESGEVASKAVVDALFRFFEGYNEQPGEDHFVAKVRLARDAVSLANTQIQQFVEERNLTRSGSTAVILLFDAAHPRVAVGLHAGDSRIYRISNGKIIQVTTDHSVAAEAGIANEKRLPKMFRGMITRAVGLKPQVDMEATITEVEPGDLFLVCSDGLYGMLSDKKILKCVKQYRSKGLDSTIDHLIAEANEAGGKDNISVVLVEAEEHEVFHQPSLPFEGLGAEPITGDTPRSEPGTSLGPDTAETHMETEPLLMAFAEDADLPDAGPRVVAIPDLKHADWLERCLGLFGSSPQSRKLTLGILCVVLLAIGATVGVLMPRWNQANDPDPVPQRDPVPSPAIPIPRVKPETNITVRPVGPIVTTNKDGVISLPSLAPPVHDPAKTNVNEFVVEPLGSKAPTAPLKGEEEKPPRLLDVDPISPVEGADKDVVLLPPVSGKNTKPEAAAAAADPAPAKIAVPVPKPLDVQTPMPEKAPAPKPASEPVKEAVVPPEPAPKPLDVQPPMPEKALAPKPASEPVKEAVVPPEPAPKPLDVQPPMPEKAPAPKPAAEPVKEATPVLEPAPKESDPAPPNTVEELWETWASMVSTALHTGTWDEPADYLQDNGLRLEEAKVSPDVIQTYRDWYETIWPKVNSPAARTNFMDQVFRDYGHLGGRVDADWSEQLAPLEKRKGQVKTAAAACDVLWALQQRLMNRFKVYGQELGYLNEGLFLSDVTYMEAAVEFLRPDRVQLAAIQNAVLVAPTREKFVKLHASITKLLAQPGQGVPGDLDLFPREADRKLLDFGYDALKQYVDVVRTNGNESHTGFENRMIAGHYPEFPGFYLMLAEIDKASGLLLKAGDRVDVIEDLSLEEKDHLLGLVRRHLKGVHTFIGEYDRVRPERNYRAP